MAKPPAHMGGAEGVFEIEGRSKTDHGPSRKSSFECASEAWLICNASDPARGRRPLIAIAAKIESGGTILSHTLHLPTQRRGVELRVEHSPHHVPVVRPQMQQAFVVLARDGIF